MAHYSVILILLALAIVASPIARKTNMPYPILLILVGIGVGFIPGFDYIPFDPEVVFLLFLPPILYDAAAGISFSSLRKNISLISIMSISLVFATMTAIAVVAYWLIPGMSWPVAFVLGAILSPPDAVAATGITKSLSLSHRVKTILEGESLINDASAIIAYRVALGIAVGSLFEFWSTVALFFASILGGCLIGAILAVLLEYGLKKIPFEKAAIISLNMLMPFVAFLVADELKVSGVLAVVAFGLISATRLKRDSMLRSTIFEEAVLAWKSFIFMLNGLIFILIGLEFPQILHSIDYRSLPLLILCSFAILAVALMVRILALSRYKMKLGHIVMAKVRSRHPMPEEHKKRVRHPLSWKEVIILGSSGMRGIVSLATAIALPVALPGGEAFPLRSEVLFITALTVVLMLVIQGLGLPLIIKWLQPKKVKS